MEAHRGLYTEDSSLIRALFHFQVNLAVSVEWRSLLWVALQSEPCYFGVGIVGPLIFGNSQCLEECKSPYIYPTPQRGLGSGVYWGAYPPVPTLLSGVGIYVPTFWSLLYVDQAPIAMKLESCRMSYRRHQGQSQK